MMLGGGPEDGGDATKNIQVPEQPEELGFETRRYPIQDQRTPNPPPREREPMELPTPDLPETRPQARHVEITPEYVPDPLIEDAGQAAEQAAADIGGEPLPEEERPEIPPAGTEGIVDAPEEEPVTVVQPEAPPSAAPSGQGRYIVQVASFGSVNNANRLGGQLTELGYTVATDTVKSDVGTLHRVRVGPYASESDADRAVAALKNQVRDVTPRVMDMQPEKSSPVTQPSDPLVRWVVQVGSFSSSSNADNLVARLKLEGLSAYKEAVNSGGATIYRVRVGPYIERDEAIRVDGQINDRLSIDGVVMSAD
jgi:DedD protein